MLLQLYERSFDVPVDPAAFEYTPGDVDWVDLTARRLERLREDKESRLAATPDDLTHSPTTPPR